VICVISVRRHGSLGLDISQTAGLIESFDKAGIDAGTTVMSLNHAATTFAAHNIDLKTGLADTITQMKGSSTPEMRRRQLIWQQRCSAPEAHKSLSTTSGKANSPSMI
jgi:hypothetical protein